MRKKLFWHLLLTYFLETIHFFSRAGTGPFVLCLCRTCFNSVSYTRWLPILVASFTVAVSEGHNLSVNLGYIDTNFTALLSFTTPPLQ